MKVDLVVTTPNDEPALSRLMQLYAYDFSEFMGLDVGDDALFHGAGQFSRCWSGVGRHAYFCKVDGRLAGFVIVDEKSRLNGDPEVVDVAQFFVMRKYRRMGVGSICAALTFDLFARKWEVRQEAKNGAATKFWRKAIHGYTGGRFDDAVLDDERWRGAVQSFDARDTKRVNAPA